MANTRGSGLKPARMRSGTNSRLNKAEPTVTQWMAAMKMGFLFRFTRSFKKRKAYWLNAGILTK